MSILSELKNRVLILDGSMGALLQARGLPAGYAPDLWNLENPSAIEGVHREYAEAGADIVITNTFGASRIRLAEYNAVDRLKQINHAGVEIARKGAPNCAVAGSLGPIGGIMAPAGDISFDEGVTIFREQIVALVEAGVDLLIVETMFDLMEMKAAVIAANEVRGSIPIICSMTYTADGLTDTGTDPETAAVTLEALGVEVIGANCSVGPETMVPVIERLHKVTSCHISVEPNAGMPRNVGGETIFDLAPEKLCSYARPFVEAGASILGGCCGSTPDYIRMVANELKTTKPKDRIARPTFSIASRQEMLVIGDGQPFCKIGEKINPTGRKKFAASIKEGRLDMVLADARKQYEHGASVLDVNVGVPLIDEAATMARAVTAVQNVVPIPLCIDSSYPSALEAGLKVYPGKALVNSVDGEDEKLAAVAPLVKRHGASVIALLAADDIPEKAIDRIKVAEKILRHLEDAGVPKERVIFDCLALVVSAMQEGARQTLDTIRLIKSEFGCATIAGISNVSFGLPQRPVINSSFLAMAIGAGLDAAIVNPYDKRMTETVAAAALFSGRDDNCRVYIDMMEEKDISAEDAKPTGPKTTKEEIAEAIVEGNKDIIAPLAEKALAEGEDAMSLFVDTMTPAIRHLGKLFAERKKFIPHLVAAADTMKRGVAVLDPILKASQAGSADKGTIVFATVKGDIHDIGKNICVIMLENFGFNVIDLGRNVPMEDILETAHREQADILGLSALMTTTMMQMKTVIDEVHKQQLPYKVMIGGAVVTKSFADEIGADAYGKDVGDLVPTTESLMEAIRA